MNLHLVDGTFEVFRCFHGAPRAVVDGREPEHPPAAPAGPPTWVVDQPEG
jgi:hypothetical protein